MYRRLIFSLSVISHLLVAQTGLDTALIKKELSVIYERDQKVRKADSVQFRAYVDSTNLQKVKAIIEKYGWLGKSSIGNSGNYTLWLVVQHADLAIQEKYLPLMRTSVEKGESRPADLAYLEDRVLMRQNKKQIYGTQVTINQKTGAQELWPIEDESKVDERRKSLSLEPMAEYAKYFGIEYKPLVITSAQKSTITCPKCGRKKLETLPTDICLLKYKCEKCGFVLHPKKGDCCVFCSYGDYKCPSMQDDK